MVTAIVMCGVVDVHKAEAQTSSEIKVERQRQKYSRHTVADWS